MQTTDSVIYEPFYQYDTTVQDLVVVEDTAMMPVDSLFLSYSQITRPTRTSLFKSHQLQPMHEAAISRNIAENTQWIFGVIIVLVTAICAYSRIHRLSFVNILQSMVDYRAMARMVRELNLNRRNAMLPIAFIYSTALSLVLFHFTNIYIETYFSVPNYLSFLYILLIITIIFLVRNGILRFVGNTFDDSANISTYITSNYFYFLCESVILLPICLLHYFALGIGNIAITALVICIVLFFVARLLRGFKLILTNSKASNLQLFYYLCILEFVPIIILTKMLISV